MYKSKTGAPISVQLTLFSLSIRINQSHNVFFFSFKYYLHWISLRYLEIELKALVTSTWFSSYRDNIKCLSLRKNAYSNILKILPSKNENFQIKNSDIFHISAQNIDCGYSLEPHRRGGSNEYPQSMLLSRNKKNNVYPCKPRFYYTKVGFKGVRII